MDHPSTAKPENRTQPRTEDSHLLVCSRRHVWPTKRPASEKRAILQQQHAVINDRVVQQQVRKPYCVPTMFRNLQTLTSLQIPAD